MNFNSEFDHSYVAHGCSPIHPALAGPVLHPWDTGPAVAELQELLCAHGFKLRIDGDFGGITETAVKVYQRRQGLRIDGVVGLKTWALLKMTVQAGTRNLREGLTGKDVSELQGLLQICGHLVRRDGIFGPKTLQAVTAFQQSHHLNPNGIVDAVTWTTLRGGQSPLPAPPQRNQWLLNNRRWW